VAQVVFVGRIYQKCYVACFGRVFSFLKDFIVTRVIKPFSEVVNRVWMFSWRKQACEAAESTLIAVRRTKANRLSSLCVVLD